MRGQHIDQTNKPQFPSNYFLNGLNIALLTTQSLRKCELIVAQIVRQKGSRRLGLPVEFPLTDGEGKFVDQDRRQFPDRRMENYDHDALKILPTLYKLAFDLIDGVRSRSRS